MRAGTEVTGEDTGFGSGFGTTGADGVSGGDGLFGADAFSIFVVVIAVIVVAVTVLVVARGVARWNRNNRSPLVAVPAVVVAKRSHHRSHGDDSLHSSTSYSITFEIQGGERIELFVPSREYGLLAEHDRGQLQHQGTRYKGFSRTPQDR